MRYHIKTNEQLSAALPFLERLKVICIDTETSGLDPITNKVLLLQIGNEYSQYVFDVALLGSAINNVLPILRDPSTVKILHNAKFDYKFIKTNFNVELENIYDTMLAEQLLQKGKKLSGYGLDDVADKYAGAKLDKTLQSSFVSLVFGQRFSEEQIDYAATDLKHLEKIRNEQMRLLQRNGLERVADLEMGVIQATADMEINGMNIDRNKWLAAEAIARVEKQKSLEVLDELLKPYLAVDMFGSPIINYNSPKQLLAVLQKALPKEGITSTGEPDIKDINSPIIHALLNYRGMEKRITTYGRAFLDNCNPKTGRIHSNFRQLATDTGRYASSDPKQIGAFYYKRKIV